MQADSHPQMRRPFIFAAEDTGNTASAAKTNAAERQARPAEYIAMYLDRIESHLDRIATACEAGMAVNEQLRAEVHQIAHLLPNLPKR